MGHRCPIHSTELRQLGTAENGKWTGENLYNCPDCKYPDDPKVFQVTPMGLRKVEG
jgi:hypothetical protein